MNLITMHGVRGYIAENGTAHLNLEDVSRGLGFSQKKNSIEYVRWETVEMHLASIGFSQQVGKDGFIPENVFYRLAMKAKNDTAEIFQAKVADEILPSIRKHGAYMTPDTIEKTLTNPDFIIQLATKLKEEQQAKEIEIAARREAERIISLQAPKIALYDTAMNAGNNKPIGSVAKMIGYGPNKLFAFLREVKVLRQNNEPYQTYIDRGYFEVRLYSFPHSNGEIENKTQTMVTPKGIEYIHKILIEHGKLPAKGA